MLFNCEKDIVNLEQETVTKSKYSISEIGISEIQQNSNLIEKLDRLTKKKKKLHSKNTHNKSVYSSEYDFTVNTDFCKYIESKDGKYHSYTFPVTREIDNGLLENLLVTLQLDGSYKLFLISYNITEQEKQEFLEGRFIDFKDKISYTKINSNLLGQLLSKESISCVDVYYTYCTSTYNHPGGKFPDGSPCNAQATSMRTWCDYSNGGPATGGEDSGNDTDSENNDNHNNEAGSGGSTTNNDTNNDEDEETIITVPVIEEYSDPCDDLNAIIDPSKSNTKPFLENLKTTVDQSGENGFSMKKKSYLLSNNTTYTNTNLPTTTGNSIGIPTGGENYAGAHSHPSVDTYPMYSWDDIYTLFNLYANAKSGVKKEVTFMLASKSYFLNSQINVYALKIKDFRAFRSAFNKALSDIVKERPELEVTDTIMKKIEFLNKKLGKKYGKTVQNQQEKAFLENFKDFNLSLFKANDNIDNWSEIKIPTFTLNTSGIEEIPCN